MTKSRGEKLRAEITTLEDAILYAEGKGQKDLEESKTLIERIKKFFDQGTWSMAEKELSKTTKIKSSNWYLEFVEKRSKAKEPGRFEKDGLCNKYGHLMVQIRLSNVRWYYQCRICGKRGKYRSLK